MEKIDFVVTWVDGSDENWLIDRNKYQATCQSDIKKARYRDFDTMPYWFRAIEKNAPWVNNIFFVTWGHIPNWLDTKNSKLKIVRHEDFIPKEYLPVFNSTAIEVHLHRIKELSNTFVYFCDDFFLLNACREKDFFKHGLPCDSCLFTPVNPYRGEMYHYHLFNDYSKYTEYFSKKDIKKHLFKFINPKYRKGFLRNIANVTSGNLCCKSLHLPMPLLKDTMSCLWEQCPDLLTKTASSRFREITNNSLELFRGYQLLSGEFYPIYKKGSFVYTREAKFQAEQICKSRDKFLVLSDNSLDENFEYDKKIIIDAFEKKFPQKSSFEL